jgi:hypothetical protein
MSLILRLNFGLAASTMTRRLPLRAPGRCCYDGGENLHAKLKCSVINVKIVFHDFRKGT